MMTRKPWRCRVWFCKLGPSTRWEGSWPGHERWETRCVRCGTLMCFSIQPFIDEKGRRTS